MTATSTTTASKNAGKLVASTANSSTIPSASTSSGGATGSVSSNTATKKIVLYNPAIDYSAPLPQQINPDLIGAHPHAQQYINSYNAGAGGGNNSNNQVRQPIRNGIQASAFVTNAGANLLSPPSASSTSTSTSAAATVALISQQNQQQNTQQQQQKPQQQQQRLTLQTTGNLPLKLGEQSISLSNNFINHNSNNNLINELSAYKFGQQQLQLQQQQQQQHQHQHQVGFLINNGTSDSNSLLTNRSVNSSISNLLISNNVITTPTNTTTPTGTSNNNKFNAPWTQHQQKQQHQQQQQQQPNQSLIYNNSNASDAISALWGCSSNASSTSSGCSSGSNSSQPSLSPTSNSSMSRQEYRSNSKESLWSLSQTLSPISNGNINNLRDNYYANNNNNNNNNINNNNVNNNTKIGTTTHTIAASPTASLASSTTSASSGVSGLWSLSNGSNGSNSSNNSFFASANIDQSLPATNDATTHYSKISNIWEIPGNNAAIINGAQPKSRSNDLFTDLWSNININNTSTSTSTSTSASTSTNSDNSDVSSNTSSIVNVGEFDAAQIWRNATAASGGKCLTMTTSNATAASTPKQQQSLINMDIVDNGGGGGGVGVGVNGSASTTCMQLFSEDFLNYLNMLN